MLFLHMGKLLLCEEKDRLYEEYGLLHCTSQQLAELDEKAIIGKRVNKYGADVIIYRKAVPKNFKISSIDIESLFIFMVKEDDE